MTTVNILDEIVSYKKEVVKQQKIDLTLDQIKSNLNFTRPVISFEKSIQQKIVTGEIPFIAEVKKASPSKGLIRADFNPLEIASIYENTGAFAISVLTDEKYFQGSLDYLQQIARTVKIPVLRKEFIVDEYQIYQSRYYGADAILLIASILDQKTLTLFKNIAHDLNMFCLVEVHTEDELDFMLSTNTRFIGINNRDLKTFKTDINHSIRLLDNKHTCKSFIISESGIQSYEDVLKLLNAGITGFLIGESFMKEKDITKAINTIIHGKGL